jgi:hypothetical protein
VATCPGSLCTPDGFGTQSARAHLSEATDGGSEDGGTSVAATEGDSEARTVAGGCAVAVVVPAPSRAALPALRSSQDAPTVRTGCAADAAAEHERSAAGAAPLRDGGSTLPRCRGYLWVPETCSGVGESRRMLMWARVVGCGRVETDVARLGVGRCGGGSGCVAVLVDDSAAGGVSSDRLAGPIHDNFRTVRRALTE